MPALPPLPTFVIHDEPAAPAPTPEPAEPAGPVVITADMLGSLDLGSAPMSSPIVTTLPSSLPPLTDLATPTQVTPFDPRPASDGNAAAPVLPARPLRGRPTARPERSTGSLVLKVVLVALVLTVGWFVWSKVSGDDSADTGDAVATGDSTVTPATNADGQAQIMPPQQVGLPPIQVLPNPAGTFLVNVGPVGFVMPVLPTQTGASDPSQPKVAAVKFTAAGPAGVMTAVVSLDTRPASAESRATFCDVALAGVLAAEGATPTADTMVSSDLPLVRTATFTGTSGVGDFHCHYDQDYAVVLTGIGVTSPMGQPFTDTVNSLTFRGTP
ncbi:MAG: hypothetical protein ACOYMR_15940 [Ilumatobacteraceae bacterium]